MLMIAEQRDAAGELLGRPRTNRIGNADDAVAAQLEQDAGQDHADRRRRLDVGVGQPGVEREDRHLDGEADEQEQEHGVLEPRLEERLFVSRFAHGRIVDRSRVVGLGLRIVLGSGFVVSAGFVRSWPWPARRWKVVVTGWPLSTCRAALPTRCKTMRSKVWTSTCFSADVRGPSPLGRRRRPPSILLRADEVAHVGEVEGQQRDQDEHAAEQRVEEELDGGILAARPAPDADEEVHRQQHHFPEDVEQEEVQRQERAEHARFQEQEEHAVAAHEACRSSSWRSWPGRTARVVNSTSGMLMPSVPR